MAGAFHRPTRRLDGAPVVGLGLLRHHLAEAVPDQLWCWPSTPGLVFQRATLSRVPNKDAINKTTAVWTCTQL
jgi:hypothetical protein